MKTAPDSATFIDENVREAELTKGQQYLYDQFAQAFVLTGDIIKSALIVGFNSAVAYEQGRKIADHGFTQRRIINIEIQNVGEDEQNHINNRNYRRINRLANSFDEKVAVSASNTIYKIQSDTLERARVAGPTTGVNRGGVMKIPHGFDTLDGWSKAAEASQARLQKQINDSNAEQGES